MDDRRDPGPGVLHEPALFLVEQVGRGLGIDRRRAVEAGDLAEPIASELLERETLALHGVLKWRDLRARACRGLDPDADELCQLLVEGHARDHGRDPCLCAVDGLLHWSP